MKKRFAVILCALLIALCAVSLAEEWTVQAELTADQDYPVYSAPDEMSPRGADNDAVLSAGSKFQIYQQLEDWLLIQYDVDEEHSRFGFITAEALPSGMSIASPSYGEGRWAYLTEDTILTDDPLRSQSELMSLSEGYGVFAMTTMGDWAYVQSISGDWFFGFVPQSLLSYTAVYNLRDHSEDVAIGGLAITPYDDLTLVMRITTEDAPAAFLLRDELQGVDIGIAPWIEGNWYQLKAPYPEDTTSISFIPVDESGAPGETLFRVEW